MEERKEIIAASGKELKVAHFVAFTPHRCGMYETVRELVLAERALGIDARIIDPGNAAESGAMKRAKLELMPDLFRKLGAVAEPACDSVLEWMKSHGHFKVEPVKEGTKDRELEVENPNWAEKECDILVGHSGFPDGLRELRKPYIMCAHGRPRSSFLLEDRGEYPIYSGYVALGLDPRILKFVTFWESHIPNLEILVGEGRVAFVPPCVDLVRFNPNGNKYKFHDSGEFNIIITDIWREDIDPYDIVHACHLFCQKYPTTRFHMFGCKATEQLGAWRILLGRIKLYGKLATHEALVKNIEDVYRAADMMVTPHTIATRTVREALASGTPLVAAEGNPYTPFHAPIHDYKRFVEEMERCYKAVKFDKDRIARRMRQSAERNFRMENTGKGMLQIFSNALTEWKSKVEGNVFEKEAVEAVVL